MAGWISIVSSIANLFNSMSLLGSTDLGGVCRRLWLHDRSAINEKLSLSALDSVFFIKRFAFVDRNHLVGYSYSNSNMSNDMGIRFYLNLLNKIKWKHTDSGTYDVSMPTYCNHFLYDKTTGYIIADLSAYLKEKGIVWDLSSSSPDKVISDGIQSLINSGLIFVSATAGYTDVNSSTTFRKRYAWAGYLIYDYQKATKGKDYVNCYKSPCFKGGSLSTFGQLPDITTAFSGAFSLTDNWDYVAAALYFNWIYTEHNYQFLLSACQKSGLMSSVEDLQDYPPGRYSDRFWRTPFEKGYLTDYQKPFFTPFTSVPSSYSPYLPAGLIVAYYQFYIRKLTEEEVTAILSGQELYEQTSEEGIVKFNNKVAMEKVISWIKAHWLTLAGVGLVGWLIWRYKCKK